MSTYTKSEWSMLLTVSIEDKQVKLWAWSAKADAARCHRQFHSAARSSPPGKVEKGQILFDMPSEVRRKKESIGEKLKHLDESAPEAARLRDELNTELAKYDIVRKSQEELRKVRGKAISMIFQEPMSSLNPVFTAGDQIAEVILLHERPELAAAVLRSFDQGNGAGGIKLKIYRSLYKRMQADPEALLLRLMSGALLGRHERPLVKEANERAVNMLRLVRVPDPINVSKSYPYELSGGMQQRVMIAMALACKPQLLIADEPTTALDVTIQAQIIKIMRELQKDTGTTILMITHNLGIIAEICDRVGVMYAGNIVELSSKRELFKEPLHPYTLGLLAAIPRIDIELPRLEIIEGNVPNLTKPPTGCRFHPRCPYAMNICSTDKPSMIEITPGHSVACHLYTGVEN